MSALPAESAKGVPGLIWLQALVLVAAGWWVYSPSLRGELIWDDGAEITQNAVIHDPAGLLKAWAPADLPDYFPLKTMVQWCQWHLWRDRVLYYHLTNLALHVLSAFLLWRLFSRLGVKLAWAGALLFAVHPLAVESVAWISELKNVLSLPLLLMAMIAWIDWDRGQPFDSAQGRLGSPYWRALACFLAAMLCKSSVVMFPVAILLYAWWRRGRISPADLRTSAPFFGVALVLGGITVWFQSHRAIGTMEIPQGGILWRLGGAAMAAVFYFFKSVLPLDLMPIYPNWSDEPIWFQPLVCGCLILAGLGWAWRRRGTYGRAVLLGLGFFLINLVPVMGFVAMSYSRISRVADHFAYLPLLGLTGLAAAGFGRMGNLRWGGVVAVAVALALATAGRRQAATFRDGATFWSHAVARNPDAWLAENNFGNILIDRGDVAPAVALFERALQQMPRYAEAENNLGNARLQQGRVEDAIVHFRRALALKPDYAEVYCDLGDAFVQLNRLPEAIAAFDRALRLRPDYADPYSNRGLALATEGKVPEAIADYEHALRISPHMVEAHLNLGRVLVQSGRVTEGIAHYREALRLRPSFREAHNNLANALRMTARPADALPEYAAALRIDPNYAEAENNLGVTLGDLGRPADGIPHLEHAARLQPENAQTQLNLANVLAAAGRVREAERHCERALALDPNLPGARERLARLRQAPISR